MDHTGPKTFVFVLMPFSEDFADIYELGIKKACEDAGAHCERVDEQIHFDNILERVYNQIAKADVIVAEMTGKNPNVFYEVGYAHALNKQVILLTQKADDIPFDLKHYPHIVYGRRIGALKSQLEPRIRYCVDHPKDSLSFLEFVLEPYFLGESYETHKDDPQLYGRFDFEEDNFTCAVDFHNPTARIYGGGATLGLITSNLFDGNSTGRNPIKLPGEKALHVIGDIGKVFPDGWLSLTCDISAKFANPSNIKDHPHEMIMRIFTEIGTKDYPSFMNFNR